MHHIAAGWLVLSLLVAAAPLAAKGEETPRPVRVQTVQFVPDQAAVTYPGTVQARIQASLDSA